MPETQNCKIIIAGGGTGGHIYPALAIAQALVKLNPHAEVEFVGTSLGLESKIVPRSGFKLHLIQSGKLNFQGQILNKMKTLLKIPLGMIQSLILVLRLRPDFVLGVGGYASAPFLLMAAILQRKTAFWEPNAHPGMANRILSRFAPKAYLVFDATAKFLKTKQNLTLGMPLREEIEIARGTPKEDSLGKRFTILCFGGSQGSMFLNDRISDLVLSSQDLQNRIHVIHQTGPVDFERIQNKYNNLRCVEVHEYIYDMPTHYKRADILFCRGGAGTLAEAAAFGVVPLVVPLPAADDHQQKNAEALVAANAGFMFIQKQFAAAQFQKTVFDLMTNPKLRETMSTNLKKMAPLRAADLIAKDILESIFKPTKES